MLNEILYAIMELTKAVSEKPPALNIVQQVYSPKELSSYEKEKQLRQLALDLTRL